MTFKRLSGASTTEVGLLIALISIAIISVVSSTGGKLADLFNASANALNGKIPVTTPEETGPTCQPEVAEASCLAHLQNGCTETGTYTLSVGGAEGPYLCDMETNGGGWVVVNKQLYRSTVIDTALYVDTPYNVTSPESAQYRLSKATMSLLQASASEMRIDCRGTDYLEMAASNLFNGDGGAGNCNNHSAITYTSASLLGHSVANKTICTWYTTQAQGCAGAYHIDEHAQVGYCNMPNYPWTGSAITNASGDAFAINPDTSIATTDCHQSGATRYVMLR